MALDLPTYIPLAEAAERYNFGRQVLTRLVEDGRIRAARINGSVAVAEEDLKKLPDIPAPAEAMKGKGIRATDAIRKYKIASHSTLAGWRDRGIVRVLERDHKRVVYDEYTVALAAQMYHTSDAKQGIRYSRPPL